MRSFRELIETVLVEQTSTYITDFVGNPVISKLFDAYKQTYSGVNIAADPNLENQLSLIIGGKRINARDIQVPFLPILDTFGTIFDALKDSDFKDAGHDVSKNAATLEQVLDLIQKGKPSNLTEIVNGSVKKLQGLQTTSNDPLDYETINPRINPARRTILSETDKASQVAIESLSKETIHGAVTKIVAKRTAVVSRLMSGKGIKKPFQTSLLRPLFSEYKKYSTGGKIFYNKIPGDFTKVVDQLSITKLMNIAILSGEYYLALLQQYVTQPMSDREMAKKVFKPSTVAAVYGPQQTASPTGAPPTPTVQGDSLQTFNSLVNDLLCEMPLQTSADLAMQRTASQQTAQQNTNTNTNQQQNQQPQKPQNPQQQKQTTLTKQEYDQIATKIGNTKEPDYVQFLEKGISKYLPDAIYTLDTISKDPLKQAQALYDALRGIAYYTREGAGVQYRTQQAGNLMKNIAGFGGQGLYGGPS